MPAGSPTPLVATLEPLTRHGGCKICSYEPELIQAVNAAIWDGQQVRRRTCVAEAAKVLVAAGKKGHRRGVLHHADHIEQSWRNVDRQHPASGKELAVFPTDFESVTDKIALLGMRGLQVLEKRVDAGDIDSRDLSGVVRMGLNAVVERKKAEDRSKRPQITVQAIFAELSGHLEVPAGEIINVTPYAELREEIDDERRLLAAHAGRPPLDLDAALE